MVQEKELEQTKVAVVVQSLEPVLVEPNPAELVQEEIDSISILFIF